jgi:hypothetical protein
MKAWLKGGLIGVGIVIVLVVLVFGFQMFARYLVYGSGVYGNWNTCANQARNAFSESLRGPDGTSNTSGIDVEKGFNDAVLNKCGQQPEFQHKTLFDFGNNLERFIIKGELGVYLLYPIFLIPGVGMMAYFLSDSPILLIISGFLIGALIGWLISKIKSKQQTQ